MKTAVSLRQLWQTLRIIVALLTVGFIFPCAAGDERRNEDREGKTSQTIQPPRVADLFDIERQRVGVERAGRRIRTGGNLVSPAFDLIETARELGKLDELRFAVQVSSVGGEVQERCRLSMLTMIAISKGDEDAARLAAEQLYNRFLIRRFPSLVDRMPETLLVSLAVEKGMLLDESLAFLVSMLDSQIHPQNCNGPAEWDRLMTSLMGRIQHRRLPPAVIPDQVTISEHRTSAWTKAGVGTTSHPVTHLHRWIPWDEDPWTPEKLSWKLEEDSSGVTQIVGHRKPVLAGTFAERLLRYHWPIVWNSQITYEFFHRDGEVSVVWKKLSVKADSIELPENSW